jgi:hypothetical protein
MAKQAEPQMQIDHSLADTGERMLDAIKAEPVPQAITMLAQRLQSVLDARQPDGQATLVPEGQSRDA